MRSGAPMLRKLILLSFCLFVLVLALLVVQLPMLHTEKTHERHSHVDATLPPPRPGTLPRCPIEDAHDDLVDTSRKPCNFLVRNEQMENAELLYVSPGPPEEEKRYFVVDFNSSFPVSSYTGDRWRMRSRHGVLLREFKTPSCVSGSAHGRPKVHVPPCAPPEAPAPVAPAAPVSTRRAFTAEVLRGCGAERVLSSVHLAPGMDLLCLLRAPSSAVPPGGAFAVAIFAHGVRGAAAPDAPMPTHVFLVPRPPHVLDDASMATGPLAVPPESLISYAMAHKMANMSGHPCCPVSDVFRPAPFCTW